eukprot:5604116-Pleurochrysis_carterae.AAC.2
MCACVGRAARTRSRAKVRTVVSACKLPGALAHPRVYSYVPQPTGIVLERLVTCPRHLRTRLLTSPSL